MLEKDTELDRWKATENRSETMRDGGEIFSQSKRLGDSQRHMLVCSRIIRDSPEHSQQRERDSQKGSSLSDTKATKRNIFDGLEHS